MKNQLSEDEARGMTINERLFVAGLLKAFDDAVARGDRSELERILRSVYLSPDDIQAIIEQKLNQTNGAA